MNAIRVHEFGAPEVMMLESVPDLEPTAGQVLIDIKAAGVNPVDTYIRAGTYPAKPSLPYTPGIDGAGIVLAAAQDVDNVSAGDRVFVCGSVTGTYAAQCLCLAEQVFHLPDEIDLAQGAALGVPYGTAYRALFGRAKAAKGQTVVIHGASGGVGLAAVQLAVDAGLKVIATAGSDPGQELAIENGAHHALNHHDTAHFDAIMELTDGQGVDIILEMLANQNLDRDLDVMTKNGAIVIIGNRGRVEIDPRKMMAKELTIVGLLLAHATSAERTQMYGQIQAGLKKGSLRPAIAKQYALTDAGLAHREIMESSHCGKLILVPSD